MREVVELHEKDLEDIVFKGDYGWLKTVKPHNFLYLCCPFCGRMAPVPTLITLESVKPLTIKDDLRCGFCCVVFNVIDGKAQEKLVTIT